MENINLYDLLLTKLANKISEALRVVNQLVRKGAKAKNPHTRGGKGNKSSSNKRKGTGKHNGKQLQSGGASNTGIIPQDSIRLSFGGKGAPTSTGPNRYIMNNPGKMPPKYSITGLSRPQVNPLKSGGNSNISIIPPAWIRNIHEGKSVPVREGHNIYSNTSLSRPQVNPLAPKVTPLKPRVTVLDLLFGPQGDLLTVQLSKLLKRELDKFNDTASSSGKLSVKDTSKNQEVNTPAAGEINTSANAKNSNSSAKDLTTYKHISPETAEWLSRKLAIDATGELSNHSVPKKKTPGSGDEAPSSGKLEVKDTDKPVSEAANQTEKGKANSWELITGTSIGGLGAGYYLRSNNDQAPLDQDAENTSQLGQVQSNKTVGDRVIEVMNNIKNPPSQSATKAQDQPAGDAAQLLQYVNQASQLQQADAQQVEQKKDKQDGGKKDVKLPATPNTLTEAEKSVWDKIVAFVNEHPFLSSAGALGALAGGYYLLDDDDDEEEEEEDEYYR